MIFDDSAIWRSPRYLCLFYENTDYIFTTTYNLLGSTWSTNQDLSTLKIIRMRIMLLFSNSPPFLPNPMRKNWLIALTTPLQIPVIGQRQLYRSVLIRIQYWSYICLVIPMIQNRSVAYWIHIAIYACRRPRWIKVH